jgi:peptidoglycan/LPS O-acetylase OafA/YrhL
MQSAAPRTAALVAPVLPEERTSRDAVRTVHASPRVIELDLLRFAAAAAVMLYHFTYRLDTPGHANAFPWIGRVAMHGHLGVHLFFMISGFVILWTAQQKTPSGFVISRITRLYPEFWVCMLLSAAVFSFVPAGDPITLGTVIANLTMVPHLAGYQYVDGVYWTLFVELKFYVLVWLLVATSQMKRVEGWLYAWLAAATLCFLVPMPRVVRSLSMYEFAPLFIAGALFFRIRSSGSSRWRWLGVALCCVLAANEAVDQMEGFVAAGDIAASTQLETQLAVAAFFVMFAVMVLGRHARIPFARTIGFLGALTYPLYLIHNVAKVVVLRPLAPGNRWVALALAVLVAMGLAALVVVLVDTRRKQFAQGLAGLYARMVIGRRARPVETGDS